MEWWADLVDDVGQWFGVAKAFYSTNKESLLAVFSGIGLAVIAGLWKLTRWLFTKSQKAEPSSSPNRAARNRQRMLEKVRWIWIEGVLEQSLYQIARIALGFAEIREVIGHPWTLVAQQSKRATRQIPHGTPMLSVFDQFDKTLLLLGAPGSGKTTLLLELTRDLIERAKEDPAHPMPVVFKLSSWALKRPPFQTWLIDELNEQYHVPRKVAQTWIDNDQILPLLDGLDEVAEEHRIGCVEAINSFREEHGLLPLVVCSRRAEYETLPKQLQLLSAVSIQPLTRTQVEQFLASAGMALSGVYTALRGDETLWDLVDTPLMLSIVALAYQGQMALGVRIARLKGTLEERRAALFDAYIEAMLKRRENTSPYTPKQTRHWLSCLARQMTRHDQSVFYIERIQPDWLPNKYSWRIGSWLFSGLLGGLIVGLVFGLFGWLFAKPGLGLAIGLTVGLPIGLIAGLASTWKGTITLVETVQWSWKESRDGLFDGLLFGSIYGLYISLLDEQIPAIGSMLMMGLMWGPFIGAVNGYIASDVVPVQTVPNEGIRRSLNSGVRIWLFSGLSSGLAIGSIIYLVHLPIYAVFWGLLAGMTIGMLRGLLDGGDACIQHGVLRVLLWYRDYAPFLYVQFLEHAKNILFLQRVGGGYVFRHQLLMEHFAGMDGLGSESNSIDEVAGETAD